jgi:vacuolar-type H+-ATPase subunit F/Vma7
VSRVVAIGEEALLDGYALAGVEVVAVRDDRAARRAWAELGEDVGLVLLTPEARGALGHLLGDDGPIWVVLPR